MEYREDVFDEKIHAGTIKRLLKLTFKHKKIMIILMFINFFLAVVDTIFPMVMSFALDVLVLDASKGLWGYFLWFVALVLLQSIFLVLFLYFAGIIQTKVTHDLRQAAFKKLQELPFSFYDKTSVGWLIARLSSDAEEIGDVLARTFTDVFWAGGYLIFMIIVMFRSHVKLTLLALISAPFLAIASIYFRKAILTSFRYARRINSQITSAYNEGITGAITTKSLVREEENYSEFQKLSKKGYSSNLKIGRYNAIYIPVINTLISFGVGLILWQGGIAAMDDSISIGMLSLFITYTLNIFDPVRQLTAILSDLQSAQASAERVFGLIDTELDIKDSAEIEAIFGDMFHPKKENWPDIKGAIEFKNVSFYYNPKEPILSTFNLQVSPGEKIALVGETGAGKSTIVNLICRFYEPTEGEIFIDGVNYKERSQLWLQSNLGYVLQNPHLFSGSVMENIRYGDLSATDEEVIAAAKAVKAYDFIVNLEHGFNTDVGEEGNRLSTGQKQLVSFARAIVGNPKIFVLDEASSSIDTETEKDIQEAIHKILAGRTAFIVAHRLSTIRESDRILVIDKGRIIEAGSHPELMAQKGHYYTLYTNQFKEEQEHLLLNK